MDKVLTCYFHSDSELLEDSRKVTLKPVFISTGSIFFEHDFQTLLLKLRWECVSAVVAAFSFILLALVTVYCLIRRSKAGGTVRGQP